ncbi:MAG: Rrf2 family transcriptional regulator [Planctomycetes bacterium]|nr:Rrf2 family transcriptional regulator [Planctomycetota bacterium]
MKLSTRSRYGLRAVLELAIDYGNKPMQIKTIAEREDISNKYLEQLMSTLKAYGLVRSIRGPKGGYLLAKAPVDIKVSEVFTALEGPMITVECVDHPEFCVRCTDCVTRQVWADIQSAMMNVLESQTLQDLVDRANKGDKTANYQI